MSVKICVSFDRDDELMEITRRLDDLRLFVSKKEYQTGKHRRVYLTGEVKPIETKIPR